MRFFAWLLVCCGVFAAGPGLLPAQVIPPSSNFDVKAYGAVGDGKALDQAAFNRAILAAHDAGGGTVRIFAGIYKCFSIHLQSHVTLRFEPGAILLAADPTVDAGVYDPAEPNAADPYEDFGHSHWHNSLIWGENLEDVAIVGPGLIHGVGLSRGDTGRTSESLQLAIAPTTATPVPAPADAAKPKFGYPSARDSLFDGIGNKAIALKNCRDVTLRDFSIWHGGHFGVLATGVDHLNIDHLKVDTNRDGIDIDACRDVHVTDCTVNSPWDDGICLKASYGLGFARDTEDVTITGCCVSGDFKEGTMLDGTRQHFAPEDKLPRMGRIKFGTESTGGFRRIAITNCVFDHCNGLAIESVDGGVVEDVTASNLVMHDVVTTPIFVRLGARLRGPDGTTVGAIRRVLISNVTYSGADGRYGSILSGVPGHPLEDVLISNVRGVQGGGVTANEHRVHPPEKESSYPETTMFGTMPSWGLYVRHAVRLTVRDASLRLVQDDARPCVQLDDVHDATLSALEVPPMAAEGSKAIGFDDVNNVRVRDCSQTPDQVVSVGPSDTR